MTEAATVDAVTEVPEETHPVEVPETQAALLTGFDAAFCPNPVPSVSEFEVVSFYVGGSSAAHVWTPGERDLIRGRITLPIWVPSPAFDNPTQTAQACAAALKAVGIPAHATPFRAVMWDMETSEASDWLDTVCNRMASLGYDSYVYGSAGNIFSLPQRSGYIVADPTGQVHMYDHAGVVGTQYAWDVQVTGGQVDANVFLADIRDHLSVLGS